MHCHCGTNNRAPRWTFTDPCKPEVRPGAREESVHITNFPFLSSNIPSSPAYGVFISQLIRYARACSSYECFILRAVRLSNKIIGQGYVKERLRSSLRKFYGRYGDLTKQYEIPSPECYTTFWMMTTYSDTLH